MRRLFLIPLLFVSASFGADTNLQSKGVAVVIGGKQIVVKREIPSTCANLEANPQNAWGDGFAANNVPPECKKSFVATMGKISPIKIDGVETYGELETLEFLTLVSQNPKEYILVDSRTKSWFDTGTIPLAVNMPFIHFEQPQKFPKEFENHLSMLGVVKKGSKYDFTNAKKALFFCNGIWCGQSPRAIAALVKMGYPKNKILWYRGGMQDWRSVSFPDYTY